MRLLADEDAVGIIPAYAGSTDFSPSTSGAAADHPRIRGEHCQAVLPVSSLAWIIPAYAGSTGIPPAGR